MPTGTTRIRLRPANTSRVPFWGQLAIGLFWLAYVLFGMWSDYGAQDYHFLHWVFLVFTFVYLGYVLVNNAPIFGTQIYLEFTPGYIVHKNGLFRPKQVFRRRKYLGARIEARRAASTPERRRNLRPEPARGERQDAQNPIPRASAAVCRQIQPALAGNSANYGRLNKHFHKKRTGVKMLMCVFTPVLFLWKCY